MKTLHDLFSPILSQEVQDIVTLWKVQYPRKFPLRYNVAKGHLEYSGDIWGSHWMPVNYPVGEDNAHMLIILEKEWRKYYPDRIRPSFSSTMCEIYDG